MGQKHSLRGYSPTALARHLDCLFAVGFQGLRWSLEKPFRQPGWYKKRQLSKKLMLVGWECMDHSVHLLLDCQYAKWFLC